MTYIFTMIVDNQIERNYDYYEVYKILEEIISTPMGPTSSNLISLFNRLTIILNLVPIIYKLRPYCPKIAQKLMAFVFGFHRIFNKYTV